eukprot:6064153-Alexandrium_andersonii.AAC.1
MCIRDSYGGVLVRGARVPTVLTAGCRSGRCRRWASSDLGRGMDALLLLPLGCLWSCSGQS